MDHAGIERSVLQGLAVFRWAAWAWMAVVLVVSRDDLDHPVVAWALAAAALAVTVAATVVWRARPAVLLEPPAVAAELAVGLALIVFHGVVYGEDGAFSTTQSLGSVWPLVGILLAGVALGPVAGGIAGVVLGLGRVAAVLIAGADIDDGARVLSLTNTTVFYALAGSVAGYVWLLLCRAERQVAEARAREEVARTLHDGVLQTLALVERRAGDPALSRLAREQERDLRAFLFGRPVGNGADLATQLRAAAARFEDAFPARADVVVADDLPSLDDGTAGALAAAVGEALTNAGKHGGATRVTVYAEPDGAGGVFCSVKDDGTGFEPAATPEGVGLGRSVRGRVAEVGGRVEVSSRPGGGTEVRLWVP